MTDPTVDPSYYDDPCLYVCESCGAAWRVTAGLNPDDLTAMLERRDEHACAADVDRDAVEALRTKARALAEGLPPAVTDEEVDQVPMDHPIFQERQRWEATARMMGEELAIHADCDLALLETARVHVCDADEEPYETVLWCAASAARFANEPVEQRARKLARSAIQGMDVSVARIPPWVVRKAVECVDDEWDAARRTDVAGCALDTPEEVRADLAARVVHAAGVL